MCSLGGRGRRVELVTAEYLARPNSPIRAARPPRRGTLASMKSGLVVHITSADVGRRVSVRSRIPATSGGPSTTDTVGRLLRWDGGKLQIERRDGTIATLREAELLAGKIISDTPPARRSGYSRTSGPREGGGHGGHEPDDTSTAGGT